MSSLYSWMGEPPQEQWFTHSVVDFEKKMWTGNMNYKHIREEQPPQLHQRLANVCPFKNESCSWITLKEISCWTCAHNLIACRTSGNSVHPYFFLAKCHPPVFSFLQIRFTIIWTRRSRESRWLPFVFKKTRQVSLQLLFSQVVWILFSDELVFLDLNSFCQCWTCGTCR